MTNNSVDINQPIENLHDNEKLKAGSRHLRGNIAEGLDKILSGAVPGDDPLLMKFHGIYQQDDRDVRSDRRKRFLEPLYQFMVRLRIPGGRLTVEQWQGLDQLAKTFADRGLRITTRQTLQFHGIRKHELRRFMCGIRDLGLDTIAACGDDNRGVVCGFHPGLSDLHSKVAQLATETSDRLMPKTHAYREIWYGESGTYSPSEEPVYGELYLPRKFKVGFVVPPVNDVDIHGQDLGFIAIADEAGELAGFNVCVGGGMGQVDTREDSYPRLAEVIGFVDAESAPALAETIMTIQRDYGDRRDRDRARFKYTLDRLGVDWFMGELEQRWGSSLAAARSYRFEHNGDWPGWQQGDDGLWHATLHIDSGRVIGALQSKLMGFFQQYGGQIRLTTNQNMQLVNIDPSELEQVRWRLDDIGLGDHLEPTLQDAHTLSCVALPTCGLAMAEAERYTPHFLERFTALKQRAGIADIPVTLRITGCPNGCARPYLGEIALTGRAAGVYHLYLGGSHRGDRLAVLYRTNVNEEAILETLASLLERFAEERQVDERFGDYLWRTELIANKIPAENISP